jgi:hypothetical protein
VVDGLPFPLSGDGKINSSRSAASEYSGNFANRGNIEVNFDQRRRHDQRSRCKVYDFSDEITANGDPDETRTSSRAPSTACRCGPTTSAPATPQADRGRPRRPEDDCTLGTWKRRLQRLRLLRRPVQPVRAGADFRVHLPKAYRGELNVQTEDNESESTYPRLGNVTITGDGDAGWCSSGSVKMSAGIGKIKLCRGLTPAPLCSEAQIDDCENFQVDGEPAAWHPDCMCKAMQFGQIRIESLKPWAANITVDMPDTTWLNATVANQSEDKPNDCKPVVDNCKEGRCVFKDNGEYNKAAEFNYPSAAAPSGAGFNLTVLSAGCTDVDYFKDPDDWAKDASPVVEERGYLKVCTGCL